MKVSLVQQADSAETRKHVEHEAGHCPSGRLVVQDSATGEAIEPKFEPSLSLIEDTAKKVVADESYEPKNIPWMSCERGPRCAGNHGVH